MRWPILAGDRLRRCARRRTKPDRDSPSSGDRLRGRRFRVTPSILPCTRESDPHSLERVNLEKVTDSGPVMRRTVIALTTYGS